MNKIGHSKSCDLHWLLSGSFYLDGKVFPKEVVLLACNPLRLLDTFTFTFMADINLWYFMDQWMNILAPKNGKVFHVHCNSLVTNDHEFNEN